MDQRLLGCERSNKAFHLQQEEGVWRIALAEHMVRVNEMPRHSSWLQEPQGFTLVSPYAHMPCVSEHVAELRSSRTA